MRARDPQTSDAVEARREQLLRAAADVIAERGFPDTRVADVAARAGTSSALLLYYFGTKDNMLTGAVLRYAEDAFYAAAAESTARIERPSEQLEALVRLSFTPSGAGEMPGSWLLWFDLWAQAIRHPEVAAVREEFDERWRQTIVAIVHEGQAAGEFTRPVDPAEFALWFAALLDGLAVQVALQDPKVNSARAVELCMRLASDELGFPWSMRPGKAAKRAKRAAAARASR